MYKRRLYKVARKKKGEEFYDSTRNTSERKESQIQIQ